MQFKKLAATGTGGKDFLKIEAGKSVTGVFRGEPHDFRHHWVEGSGRECAGADCELCKTGNRSNFRFRINFIINENGAYTAKVFERGKTVYETLAALHSADYDLEKTVVKIMRQGSGKSDTVYTIVPMAGAKGIVTADMEAKIKQIKLHNLSGNAESAGDFATDDSVPF